jgi:hypothetical protein
MPNEIDFEPVMPANAGMHVFLRAAKAWMAGTSPAMTELRRE